MAAERVPLSAVSAFKSAEEFHALFDTLFEHSPWVTECAWQLWHEHQGAPELHSALHLWSIFLTGLYAADHEAQLRLVRAHPSLGDRARIATDESRSEQRGAGLTELTPAEHARLLQLNENYTAKHGFPFIVAVKGHDKHSIIAELDRRVHNPREVEFKEALDQIARIAWFRMLDRVDDGRTQPGPPPTTSVAASKVTKLAAGL